MYVTLDYGLTIWARKVDFVPSEVSNHPTNALIIVILDTVDPERRVRLSCIIVVSKNKG